MRQRRRNRVPRTWVLGTLLILGIGVSARALAYEKEIRSEAEVIAAKVAEQGKTTVAVVDFTDLQGHVTELGRFMAEELSVALAASGKGFQVVDRTHLRSILEEHKLASSGLIDPETAQALGKIAGVDALITGTITPFADSIHVALKVLDADTANIITSDTVNIPKTQGIQELLAREIDPGDVGGASNGSHAGTRRSLSQPVKTIDQGPFHLALEGCEFDGSQLACSVLVTNTGADQEISLYVGNSRMIGANGTEYPADAGSLGSSRGSFGIWPRDDLVQGVPVRARIAASRIKEAPDTLALIELRFDRFTVQFRGIAVGQ